MKHILIKNISLLASPLYEGGWLEIENGVLVTERNTIMFIGSAKTFTAWQAEKQIEFDKTIDASGTVVLPGFINGHHHLYQSLTRTIGTAEGKSLFNWLKFLYPIWGRLTPEAVYISAKLALVELVMSGATTVADHLYIFPNGTSIADEIRAAQEVGVRFHPTRGSMSLGESQGGLPPDYLVEDENEILKNSLAMIEEFHNPDKYSMLRVGLAPCSPFSVTSDLMEQSAFLARSFRNVHLHTHLAETIDENQFCLDMFGKRPLEYVSELGWHGDDVWFAHMVHPDDKEIEHLAAHRSGICHCPSSNMILASGIAPIRQMLDGGVKVGLGVDGSASNDSNHLLAEARQAMLLQRVGWPGFVSSADRFSAREALELATIGGAKMLARDDIGRLEVGKVADFIAFRIDDIAHAGGQADLLASLLTCSPASVWLSVINGKVIVEDGEFLAFDINLLVEKHNKLSAKLIAG